MGLQSVGGGSTRSGETWANRKSRKSIPTPATHTKTGGRTPGRGEEVSQPEIYVDERIRVFNARRFARSGFCRAITHEAAVSHGCYAFLVGKGNE